MGITGLAGLDQQDHCQSQARFQANERFGEAPFLNISRSVMTDMSQQLVELAKGPEYPGPGAGPARAR
jgi:hypothetical protein